MKSIENNKLFNSIDSKYLFYFDLLGIGQLALDNFENARQTQETAKSIAKKHLSSSVREVLVFSDSFIIIGNSIRSDIEKIRKMWLELFQNNCLARGAIVGIEHEKQYEEIWEKSDNYREFKFEKSIAIASGLEKSIKGPRIVMEKDLARKLLPKEWYSEMLFRKSISSIDPNIWNPIEDETPIEYNIVESPEGSFYDVLWMFDIKSFLKREGFKKDVIGSTLSTYDIEFKTKSEFSEKVRFYKYTLKDTGQEQLKGIVKMYERTADRAEEILKKVENIQELIRSGKSADEGKYECIKCGKIIKITDVSSHLPPCSKCSGTYFRMND